MISLLLVDDSREDRQLMEALLKSSRDDVTVTKCAGGAEAIQEATTEVFDCVLLDLRLDGEDGLDVLADLRKVKPKLPVIILTGQGGGSTISAAVRAGAAGYITKTGMLNVDVWPVVNKALRRSKQNEN